MSVKETRREGRSLAKHRHSDTPTAAGMKRGVERGASRPGASSHGQEDQGYDSSMAEALQEMADSTQQLRNALLRAQQEGVQLTEQMMGFEVALMHLEQNVGGSSFSSS